MICRLQEELLEWNKIREKPSIIEKVNPIDTSKLMFETEKLNNTPPQLGLVTSWMNNMPKTIDQLQWTLSVAGAFERHAHTYCESVFKEIRSNLLGDKTLLDEKNMPILLMKALTGATTV